MESEAIEWLQMYKKVMEGMQQPQEDREAAWKEASQLQLVAEKATNKSQTSRLVKQSTKATRAKAPLKAKAPPKKEAATTPAAPTTATTSTTTTAAAHAAAAKARPFSKRAAVSKKAPVVLAKAKPSAKVDAKKQVTKAPVVLTKAKPSAKAAAKKQVTKAPAAVAKAKLSAKVDAKKPVTKAPVSTARFAAKANHSAKVDVKKRLTKENTTELKANTSAKHEATKQATKETTTPVAKVKTSATVKVVEKQEKTAPRPARSTRLTTVATHKSPVPKSKDLNGTCYVTANLGLKRFCDPEDDVKAKLQNVTTKGSASGHIWLLHSADVHILARMRQNRLTSVVISGPALAGRPLKIQPLRNDHGAKRFLGVTWARRVMCTPKPSLVNASLSTGNVSIGCESSLTGAGNTYDAMAGVTATLPAGVSVKVGRFEYFLDIEITVTKPLRGRWTGACWPMDAKAAAGVLAQ